MGAFWGVQGCSSTVDGVTSAVSGTMPARRQGYGARYETVSHRRDRACRVQSASRSIQGASSYGHILQIYFYTRCARPNGTRATKGRTEERNTVQRSFQTTPEQAAIAGAYVDQLKQAHAFPTPVVTTIEPGRAFYPAEAYHQDFLTLHPTNSYIVYNDLPKIRDLQRLFPDLYRADPVLVAAQR